MYILVTGGLGFIGSHTCVELLNNNYNIIVIDNLCNSKIDVVDKIYQITNRNILFFEYDLLDKENIEEVFKTFDIDAVIHFAGLKSVGESVNNPLLYYEINLLSTLNLLKVMKEYNCNKIIFSSSATVYGNSTSPLLEDSKIGEGITNPYGKTKYMIENILKDFSSSDKNMNITSLRYFNPIGAHNSGYIGEDPNGIPNNLMPFVLKVAQQNNTDNYIDSKYDILSVFGNDYDTNDGTCIRDYIHVVDLAKAHIQALKHIKLGYNVYNIGTGNGYSVLDVINEFQNVNKIKLPYEIVSRRPGDIAVTFCNNELALKEINWKPQFNLTDMCSDAWNYQLKNTN